jgi:transcriptional regulator with XRE-family HTH domain
MQLNLIREARKKHRLSQGKLAAEIGISAAQISRIESGKRRARLDEAIKIAQLLGLTADEIVNEGPPPSPVAEHIRPHVPRGRGSKVPPNLYITTTKFHLPFPEGKATLEIPDTLSVRSYGALKVWLELIAQMINPETK